MSRPSKKKHTTSPSPRDTKLSPRDIKTSPPVGERVGQDRADQFLRGCLAFNQYFLNVFAAVIPADQTAFWDAAYTVLKASGILTQFTEKVIKQEVEQTTSAGKLFRTNTGCAGLISAIMRRECDEFVVSYVIPLLNEINQYGHPLEVNPNVVDQMTRTTNERLLFELIDTHVDRLPAQAAHITDLLKLVLQQVRSEVTAKFGPQIALIAVGGLFFLRFLMPVLLTPNMFIATYPVMSAEIRRTVMYFTKIIQLISNQTTLPVAEDYLRPIQEYLPLLQPTVAEFLIQISTSDFKEQPQTASATMLWAAQKMIDTIGSKDYLARIAARAKADRMDHVWNNVFGGIQQIGNLEERTLNDQMNAVMYEMVQSYLMQRDHLVEAIVDTTLKTIEVFDDVQSEGYTQEPTRPLRRSNSANNAPFSANPFGKTNEPFRVTKLPAGQLLRLKEVDARPVPKTLAKENGVLMGLLNEKERGLMKHLNFCSDFTVVKGCFRLLSLYLVWSLKDLTLQEELSAGDEFFRSMGNLVLAQDDFETLFLKIRNSKVLLFDVMANQTLLQKRLVFLNSILDQALRFF